MKNSIVTSILVFFWLIANMATMCACSSGSTDIRREEILFDFEMEADLDRLHWKCHVVYSLSDQHVTHGMRSLKLELYPSAYPGLSPKLDLHDWRSYRSLCFDIYNPYDHEETISLRVDDMKVANDYADRVNQRKTLSPGMNQVVIPFETLVTSGTQRMLNLKTIERFLLFQADPREKKIFFLDNVRLVSGLMP